ncbi:MAG: hypothetical protein SH856_15080 [Flavobacteriales bacterium]|nr:hypothetical protein [Flavobacteriales bacterium]
MDNQLPVLYEYLELGMIFSVQITTNHQPYSKKKKFYICALNFSTRQNE